MITEQELCEWLAEHVWRRTAEGEALNVTSRSYRCVVDSDWLHTAARELMEKVRGESASESAQVSECESARVRAQMSACEKECTGEQTLHQMLMQVKECSDDLAIMDDLLCRTLENRILTNDENDALVRLNLRRRTEGNFTAAVRELTQWLDRTGNQQSEARTSIG